MKPFVWYYADRNEHPIMPLFQNTKGVVIGVQLLKMQTWSLRFVPLESNLKNEAVVDLPIELKHELIRKVQGLRKSGE